MCVGGKFACEVLKKINLYRDAVFYVRHIQLVKLNWWLFLPQMNSFSKFQNNNCFGISQLNSEYLSSYGLSAPKVSLKFIWHNVLYHLMLIQEIAVNCSQQFEQKFLLERVFFEKLSRVHLSINFVKNIYQ